MPWHAACMQGAACFCGSHAVEQAVELWRAACQQATAPTEALATGLGQAATAAITALMLDAGAALRAAAHSGLGSPPDEARRAIPAAVKQVGY